MDADPSYILHGRFEKDEFYNNFQNFLINLRRHPNGFFGTLKFFMMKGGPREKKIIPSFSLDLTRRATRCCSRTSRTKIILRTLTKIKLTFIFSETTK